MSEKEKKKREEWVWRGFAFSYAVDGVSVCFFLLLRLCTSFDEYVY